MLAYTIGATALANPTRWISDPGTALSVPPEGGEDLSLPGVAGEVPRPRVLGVAFDEFEVRITGLVQPDGTPATNDTEQFLTNLRALQSLLRPSVGATLSVTKTLSTASGPVVLGPTDARCISDLTPRMEVPWTGTVLVRLKVYGGWA